MNIILFEKDELNVPLKKSDPRSIHLLKVLRKKTGDAFLAGIVNGNRGHGVIKQISEDNSLTFEFEFDSAPPAKLPLVLATAFNRPIQTRRILREAANFGAAEIAVFGTDLGEKSYRDTNLFKDGGARGAMLEGIIQGRDTVIPTLKCYFNLKAWLQTPDFTEKAASSFLIACDNAEAQGSFFDFFYGEYNHQAPREGKSFIIAAGGERGWSQAERALLREAGFKLLSLGERPLRSECACAAACAFVAAINGSRGAPFIHL